MSAFVVDDKTINEILSFIKFHQESLEFFRRKGKLTPPTREAFSSLGQNMFKLNTDAVNYRYGENQAQEFRPLDYKYRGELPPRKIQVFKSLQCWLYQCSEGEIPEHPLFKLFDDYSSWLAVSIVYDLPDWDNARWG